MNISQQLERMSDEIRSQDNRMTSHPQYRVMHGKDTIDIFFTNKGAQNFIKMRNHDHNGDLHIYISSGWRNEEWRLARAVLGALDGGA